MDADTKRFIQQDREKQRPCPLCGDPFYHSFCLTCHNPIAECEECHAELYHDTLPIALLMRGTGGVGNKRVPKDDEEA